MIRGSVIVLRDWEMVVGKVENIENLGGYIEVELSCGKLIIPPAYAVPLQNLIGERVGILKTDIDGKEFMIAQVNGSGWE